MIAIAIPLVVLAVLLEPILFPRAVQVRAWTPPAMVAAKSSIQPDFGESKTGAIPLLVLEGRTMDPKARARRHKLLHNKLAQAQLGPLRLALIPRPEQVDLSKLPARCHVILELSLRDLILTARPPSYRHDPTAVLKTRSGSFPAALWPLRRMGNPGESDNYNRVSAILLQWKQQIEVLQGKLAILYLPQPIECDPRQLAVELEILGLDSALLQSSRAARRLQDLCNKLGIPFVDPTRLLAGAGRKKRPLFVDVGAAPFEALYTERAENLILGRLTHQGIQPLFR